MNTHINKSKDNKSKAVANNFDQKKSSVQQGFAFVDNRPASVVQRKLKEHVNQTTSSLVLPIKEEAEDQGCKTDGIITQRQAAPEVETGINPAIGNNQVIQMANVTKSIDLTGPDETVEFKIYDELASMDAPTIGENDLNILARPVANPAGTPAYVGNVISTASGKDKTADQVAGQYAVEGFPNLADARNRFALVYLANRENKPWEALGGQTTAIADRSSGQAAAYGGYPLTAGYSLWNRKWALKNIAKTPAEIRTAIARAADPAAARATVEGAANEVSWPKSEVPNHARNKVKNIQATATYLNRFNTEGYSAYVHVGDADAVTMMASATPDDAATSLFTRFDASVVNNPDANAIAGAYRFAKRPGVGGAAPAHSAGADTPGADLMARTNQVVAASELDTVVRGAMAGSHPMAPYFPEPNLLISREMYTSPDTNFGDRGPEWENFRKTLIDVKVREWLTNLLAGVPRMPAAPPAPGAGPAWTPAYYDFPATAALPAAIPRVIVAGGAQRVTWNDQRILATLKDAYPLQAESQDAFAFDPTAALVTDVGRFDNEYVASSGAGQAGTDYTGGDVDPLALFDQRAAQSHAKTRSVLAAVSKIYDLAGAANQEWISKVIKTLMPQSLFADLSGTRELDLDEEATKEAASGRSVAELVRVQPHLAHFAAFTQIVSDLIANPTDLTDRAGVHRLARVALGIAGAGLIFQDKTSAVRDVLEARGLNAGLIGVLKTGEGEEAEQIWNVATDGTNPPGFAQIVALVKSVGDAIAGFLLTYEV